MQVVGGKSALGIIHPIWLVNLKGERGRGRELAKLYCQRTQQQLKEMGKRINQSTTNLRVV